MYVFSPIMVSLKLPLSIVHPEPIDALDLIITLPKWKILIFLSLFK